jgi:hypothetical protein
MPCKASASNPKSEYRNPKQIPSPNVPMTKTSNPDGACGLQRCATGFGSFGFWSFDIVSSFGFRASNLVKFWVLRKAGSRSRPYGRESSVGPDSLLPDGQWFEAMGTELRSLRILDKSDFGFDTYEHIIQLDAYEDNMKP